MNRIRFFFIVTALVIHSALICSDPHKNIIKAAGETLKTSAVRSSLDKFTKTFAHELASKLNNEERNILNDIFGNMKEMLTLAKEENNNINNDTLDQPTKDQRTKEIRTKLIEQCHQLDNKISLFYLAAQDQSANQENSHKDTDEFFNHVMPLLNHFTHALSTK
jgi:hypothetical protein